mmetsp:Transcript_26564/g.43673  ORF Transcript_26564/g.43673 Transcript_26564/m.43673 type:complete len:309 (+) Transcript_26564:1211-2137(+)
MDGAVLESDSLQDILGVGKDLFELGLVSKDHEFFAEAHKGSSVARSFVVFEHGSGLDFSISNDRVYNVLGTSKVLLQKNSSVGVVAVLSPAVSLVFTGKDLMVGIPDGLFRVAECDTHGSGTGLWLDHKAFFFSLELIQESLNIVLGAGQTFTNSAEAGLSNGIGLGMLIDLGLGAVHATGLDVSNAQLFTEALSNGIFEQDSMFRATHDCHNVGGDGKNLGERLFEMLLIFVNNDFGKVFFRVTRTFQVLFSRGRLRSITPHKDHLISQRKHTLLKQNAGGQGVDKDNSSTLLLRKRTLIFVQNASV